MTYDLYTRFFTSLAGALQHRVNITASQRALIRAGPDHTFVVALGSGALSGATQMIATYPLDVVRSRIMLGRGYHGARVYVWQELS